ncbi:hypothetical protein GQX74_014296 [Glossina fuscipes]|nr:hypothetical protein GQX74_014296 [Glossina fuscipes]
MVFMAAATALAKAKTTPTEAPNSGPKERDMIKYTPPPFTSPLVLIADNDRVVITHTIADIVIMPNVCNMPDSPTTHDRRRNSITPHMFITLLHGLTSPVEVDQINHKGKLNFKNTSSRAVYHVQMSSFF